jgi:hypothetical protein
MQADVPKVERWAFGSDRAGLGQTSDFLSGGGPIECVEVTGNDGAFIQIAKDRHRSV